MQVYRSSDEKFRDLYHLCRETEGVEYIGSIPQPKLAEEMRNVPVLAYPNTFAETSCIAVMEAMAAGCQIITSDLGALPETTAGFAKLIPLNSSYNQNFINATITALKNPIDKSLQIAFVKKNYNWTKRALEWEDFLTAVLVTSYAY